MRPLRGERYATRDGVDQGLVDFIASELPFLSYQKALAFYGEVVPSMSLDELALLGCNDRFFLLTGLLNRANAVHPWIYDRVREVEAEPDGCLDLWAREHFKSSSITFAGSIQEVVSDPEITIGIFSNTTKVSRVFLAWLMQELATNQFLQQIYSDVLWENPSKEAPVWSLERGIVVKRAGNPKESTIEAHGLIDALPTGRHFGLLIYDDVVTEHSVTNPEQVRKTTERLELSYNLGSGMKPRRWYIGTRYCTIGSMRVLMDDWSQRPIADVRVGDVVVGWELRDGKRYLCRSKVVDRGVHFAQPVRRYGFADGSAVVCTSDHRWWRGPWGSGPEYQPLSLPGVTRRAKGPPRGRRATVRRLLVPVDRDESRDAGWLAGFFDGEGTVRKNTHHPSAVIGIVQTMHNPGLIEETRRVLKRLGFAFGESWHRPSVVPTAVSKPDLNKDQWKDRCTFFIRGGWRERYRFLASVSPARRDRIAETLFCQLSTQEIRLVSDDDAGSEDVHWLQTESGNYIVEGLCSSNSFGDTYGQLLEKNIVKPRVYPATADGTLKGAPVFLTQEAWDEKVKTQRSQVASQMLQNPLAGSENMFQVQWLRPYGIRPRRMNVYIMGDPSLGKSKTSDRTAIAVIGVDQAMNRYLLDGYCHRMKLSERWTCLRDLWKKWSTATGVEFCAVGYERYGQQTDDEYFQERMEIEKVHFPIRELSWVREGLQSKSARVERLEPHFRNAKFHMPGIVWHPDYGEAVWSLDEKGTVIQYRAYEGPTREEQAAINRGERYRLLSPIMRKDEDGSLYDLFRVFVEEFAFFPFSPRDDLIDATSRIEDMEPIGPTLFDDAARESAMPIPADV